MTISSTDKRLSVNKNKLILEEAEAWPEGMKFEDDEVEAWRERIYFRFSPPDSSRSSLTGSSAEMCRIDMKVTNHVKR